mmetsp:Transcript_6593/g.17713  ORF Transcript_6593/g.17713 Transcript_6593/m.17713 type:complete len:245 (+) Transcript_6593:96-830(+)
MAQRLELAVLPGVGGVARADKGCGIDGGKVVAIQHSECEQLLGFKDHPMQRRVSRKHHSALVAVELLRSLHPVQPEPDVRLADSRHRIHPAFRATVIHGGETQRRAHELLEHSAARVYHYRLQFHLVQRHPIPLFALVRKVLRKVRGARHQVRARNRVELDKHASWVCSHNALQMRHIRQRRNEEEQRGLILSRSDVLRLGDPREFRASVCERLDFPGDTTRRPRAAHRPKYRVRMVAHREIAQ